MHDEPREVTPTIHRRLGALHALAEWVTDRSPIRIGSRAERRLHWLAARVPGLVNEDWHPTISHGIARRMARVLAPPLRGPVFAPTTLGFDLCVDAACGAQYWQLGAYERGTLGLIRRVMARGGTFIDVGASVGQMSLYAARLPSAPRVLAFEPDETRFRYLSLGVVRAGAENVELHPVALGASSGPARLRTDLVSPTLLGAEDVADASPVELRRLDDLIPASVAQTVALIKIDVEGTELDVLRGATEMLASEHAPVVCFEAGVHGQSDSVAAFLSGLNDYRLFRFPHGQNADDPLVPLHDVTDAHRGENVIACRAAHAGLLPEVGPSRLAGR